MYKISKHIKCRTTLKLLRKLTGNRSYYVCIGGQTSKTRRIVNGVPQGTVLSSTLFNLCISDLPGTDSLRFGYADDLAIATQARHFDELENTLSRYINTLHSYFNAWYLTMSQRKTFSIVYLLDNDSANRNLKVIDDTSGTLLSTKPYPRYLGVYLNKSLTYRYHLESTAQKLKKKRVAHLAKLAGTSWVAHQEVLRNTALSLCYSAAENCSPVWARSAHTENVDVQLNFAMRIISGTLKPISLE